MKCARPSLVSRARSARERKNERGSSHGRLSQVERQRNALAGCNNIAFTSGKHSESCVLVSVYLLEVRVAPGEVSFRSVNLMSTACIVVECERRQH